ncbi:hypothetical protein FGW37_31045 [Streptomyces rectiverticillatus]|uniref:hypothetical protein n=1 Tax=Streptomyces rectiverticillatus TaxID=173860 RepID=UPI0015C30E1A|nr:hypothetical protein [Streptomyces rectiverticillatus]QLE75433.1 hypothetical protein FGW37_31045 [Streptomyces rectiverticillatus]
MSPPPKTLLVYTVPSPALSIGTSVNLALTIEAPADVSSIQEITVDLPVGEGTNDLTNEPGSIVPQVIKDPTDTVTFTKARTPRGRYVVATGERTRIELSKGMKLVLRLDSVRVNKKTGHPDIVITEKTNNGSRQHRIPLSKFAAGFVFKDFRPTRYLVDLKRDLDKNAELRWYIDKAGQRPDVRLTWANATGAIESRPVSDDASASVAVIRDTAFQLAAKLPGPGGRPLTHTLNTFVTVAWPLLTATGLSVHHAARLFANRHDDVPGFEAYTQRSATFSRSDSVKLADRRVFRAATDGFLTARVHHLTPGTATAMRIELLPPDGDTGLHVLDLTGREAEDHAHVMLPVPHRHRIALSATGHRLDRKKTTLGCRLNAEWRPIGTGALEHLTV